MITLESDLKLSFEHLRIKFQSILDGHREEIERLIKKSVEEFDFESVLRAHVENKILEGLEEVFAEIDLSEHFKIQIRTEIERRMSDKEEK